MRTISKLDQYPAPLLVARDVGSMTFSSIDDDNRNMFSALLSRPVIEFETDVRLGLGEFGIQTRVVQPEDEEEPEQPVHAEEESGRTMLYSTAGRVADPEPAIVRRRW